MRSSLSLRRADLRTSEVTLTTGTEDICHDQEGKPHGMCVYNTGYVPSKPIMAATVNLISASASYLTVTRSSKGAAVKEVGGALPI